jgi:hypothetical protein
MSVTTDNEITVLAVLVAYIVLALGYAWLMTRRADRLIAQIRQRDPDGLWKELGSPRNLKEATRDPRRRWSKLLRDGRYRRLCSPDMSARIEDFLRHLNAGMLALALLGGAILYRYWDIFRPLLL